MFLCLSAAFSAMIAPFLRCGVTPHVSNGPIMALNAAKSRFTSEKPWKIVKTRFSGHEMARVRRARSVGIKHGKHFFRRFLIHETFHHININMGHIIDGSMGVCMYSNVNAANAVDVVWGGGADR